MVVRGEGRQDWVPRTVSDTLDGDVSQSGAMKSLSNLIFNPGTPNTFQCRPAAHLLDSMASLGTGATVVTDGLQSDGIVYGMVTSTLNPGHDQPFAYRIVDATFLPISNIRIDNTPVSQPSTGDWVPPTIVELGGKVVVTHLGFSLPNAFGYIDTSGFTSSVIVDTVSGSPTLHGSFSTSGIGPGYTLSGAGIPSNTSVVDMDIVAISTTGNTHTSTTIDGIPSTTGMAVGQDVAGPGIPTGATVASIVSSTAITISAAATASSTGQNIFVTGNTITMSQNAAATANGITASVSGGTADNPLWAAGNTTGTQLAGVAQTVNSFNNRFYFSVGNAESFTDTLSLNMVTSTQTLFIGDSSPIVATAQTPLSTTSQAVIAGLMLYKTGSIYQITGDPVTSNLAVSEVSPTVGSDSPRSIVNTPDGQMFRAVDGIRLVEFTGLLSEPDPDLAVPFIYSQYPSRVSAGYNTNIYRICVQNANVPGTPYQEYWFDLKNAGWTGPHTFPQDLALPYKSTFILFSNQFAPGMYQSDVVLDQGGNIDDFEEFGVTDLVAEDGSTLLVAEDGTTQLVTENNLQFVFLVAQDGSTQLVAEDGVTLLIAEDAIGVPLNWEFQTVPMTDSGNFYANCLLNSIIEIAIPQEGNPITFTSYDEGFNQLNQVFIQEAFSAPIWGQFTWGLAKWGATTTGLQPTSIPWSAPFEYNRLSVDVSGVSSADLKIGTLHVEGRGLSYIRR